MFFEALSRCAHPAIADQSAPFRNEHGIELPAFWRQGPHFGVFVGLTEAGIFADPSVSLRDACVFLHDESDRVRLTPPQAGDYERWCLGFLEEFSRFYVTDSGQLSDVKVRQSLQACCQQSIAGERLRRRLDSGPSCAA